MPCTTYDPKLKIETNISLIDDWRYMDDQQRGHAVADALRKEFNNDVLDSMIAHLIYRGEVQTIMDEVICNIRNERKFYDGLKEIEMMEN